MSKPKKMRYFRDSDFGFAETTLTESSEDFEKRLIAFYTQAPDQIQLRALLLVLPLVEEPFSESASARE